MLKFIHDISMIFSCNYSNVFLIFCLIHLLPQNLVRAYSNFLSMLNLLCIHKIILDKHTILVKNSKYPKTATVPCFPPSWEPFSRCHFLEKCFLALSNDSDCLIHAIQLTKIDLCCNRIQFKKMIGCRFIKKQQILNVLFQQMPRKASFLFYTNIHTRHQ